MDYGIFQMTSRRKFQIFKNKPNSGKCVLLAPLDKWIIMTPTGIWYWFEDWISAQVNCDILVKNCWVDGIPTRIIK